MAMRFVLDRVENCRFRDTINGLEIIRRCTVFDVPVYAAGEAWKATIDVLKDPQCPAKRSAFPDPATKAFLEERNGVAYEAGKRRFEMDLIYRSPLIVPGGRPVWVFEDSPNVSHILTNATAGGQKAGQIWYMPGHTGDTTKPSGADFHGVQVHRVLIDRILRVTTTMDGNTWRGMRADLHDAGGKINSSGWGSDDRGAWLFLGPHSRTIDRGSNYDVNLEFWKKEGGWYEIDVWTDEFGRIPDDVATLETIRAAGPPAEGDYVQRNGVTQMSVQFEADFGSLFTFTPDDEGNPPEFFNGTGV